MKLEWRGMAHSRHRQLKSLAGKLLDKTSKIPQTSRTLVMTLRRSRKEMPPRDKLRRLLHPRDRQILEQSQS